LRFLADGRPGFICARSTVRRAIIWSTTSASKSMLT
jgi:hypothetical protein